MKVEDEKQSIGMEESERSLTAHMGLFYDCFDSRVRKHSSE